MEFLLAATYRSHGALAAEEIAGRGEPDDQEQNVTEHFRLPVPSDAPPRSMPLSRSLPHDRRRGRIVSSCGHAFDQLSPEDCLPSYEVGGAIFSPPLARSCISFSLSSGSTTRPRS